MPSQPSSVTMSPSIRPATNEFPDRIDQSVDSRGDRMVRFRRRLHATPEPSGREHDTTALVAETLTENGLSPRVMEDGIGVIVDLDLGADADSTVALRAELDCVSVDDEKQVDYASTRPGLCHACGHDAHSTMVLAALLALSEQRDDLRGLPPRHNIRAIFQPAEETAQGARSMIRQGAVEGVEAIIALHVDPFIDVGAIGVRSGPITAACDSFRVTVSGRSGHSARPYEANDPIPAATNVVSLFYQLCPRSMDNRFPLALTVASITAGHAFNAIPDRATITGTLRAARVSDIEAVRDRMRAVVTGVAEATGCDISLEFVATNPPTDNDPRVVDTIAAAGRDLLGPTAVHRIEVPSLGAEDFAFYQELIPGAMVRLGDRAQRRAFHGCPLHSSTLRHRRVERWRPARSSSRGRP